MPAKLSVCLMVKDEERHLPACLESVVPIAHEIVVVDSGSRDRTVEIARGFGARVIERPWAGNVSQRRFSIEQASNDWTFYVDADERVSPALADAIRDALAREGGGREGYRVARRLFYLGRWMGARGLRPEWQVRLFRRSRARVEGTDPHDRVIVDGPVGRLGGELLHYSFRDLGHQIEVTGRYTGVAARALADRGRRSRLTDLVLRPLGRFVASYVLRLGFLDGVPGLVMAVNHAYAGFMKYARLWELEHARGG